MHNLQPQLIDRMSAAPASAGLFNSRYATLASNTIDYWMLPDDDSLTEQQVLRAMETAPVHDEATFQLYIHVPFCAQRCRFCAFSGGNSLSFREADRYSRLLVEHLKAMMDRTPICGRTIRSVNIGGGSPDLLGPHIGRVLEAVNALPGFGAETEVSVELTLSTAPREFIEELVEYNVTKVAFGIQSLDRQVRQHMRQPTNMDAFDRVLGWIDGRIPVVNADLITGLPGQTLKIVDADLRALMNDPRINCVSSYLLTPGAAPSLLAALATNTIPQMPRYPDQALMRLHTYGTFLRNGWVRRGTNSYVNPDRMSIDVLERLAGNECIGAAHYEDFLLGVGPQAISSMPGARIENRVDIDAWCEDVEHGRHPFHLPKCSTVHQQDTGLWVFPLRFEGLPQARYDRMLATGAISRQQMATMAAFEEEGLVVHTESGYELSILGEVFMGHMVHDLKNENGQRAVDEYVAEGRDLGLAIATGSIADANDSNNRQIALPLLHGSNGNGG